jgi:DNA-binding NarL/FixJ family response regulator
MEKIRILVVDDHPVVREGVRLFLEGDKKFEIVGEAESGEEAIKKVEELKPDVVLLDLKMPGIGGVEATKRMKERFPDVRILILTVYVEDEYVKEALRAGAQGYLLKEASQDELKKAIIQVNEGGSYIASKVMGTLVEEVAGKRKSYLTQREREVLKLMSEGLTNKEIAEELGLGIETIKTHARNIFEKLGAADRAQAVAIALRKGLLE